MNALSFGKPLLRYGFLSAVLTTFTMGNAFAISSSSEEVKRLTLQGQIDTNAPFSKTLWAGAHNGYAAESWGDGDYSLQINQQYRPKHLFQYGIRLTEYDVYPASGLSSNPELCHLGQEEKTECITFALVAGSDDYASFGDGLDEIAEFLEDGNMDKVIFLKLEVYDADDHQNFRNKVGEKIESRLGDMVFKPTDWGYTEDDCPSLPVQHVTKKDILAAGRNVVIMTQVPRKFPHTGDDDLCDYHDESNTNKMRRNVWIGVDEMDANGNLTSNEPLAQNNDQNTPDSSGNDDPGTHYDNGNMGVALDAATSILSWFDWLTDTTTDIKYEGDDVVPAAESGKQLLELALIEYDGNNKTPDIEDFVWSWSENYPSGYDECAWLRANNEIRDYSCTANRPHACVTEDRQWKVSTSENDWDVGFNACASLADENGNAGNYSYGMPYNARERNDLVAAKAAAGVSDSRSVWVNYKEVVDGFWLANNETDLDYGYSKTTSRGNNSHDGFDDIDFLKRKILSGGKLNLSYIRMEQNGNKDKVVQFKTCYKASQAISQADVDTSDMCRQYGDNGGGSSSSITLDIANGEYIKTMKQCDDGNFVRYLEFTTNTGRSISKGKSSKGTCYTVDGGNNSQIFAFHGTRTSGGSSDKMYAIGAHMIDKDLVDPGYYATDWLNRDSDMSNGDAEKFSQHKSEGNIDNSCSSSDMVGYAARRASDKLDYTLTGFKTASDTNSDGFYCWRSDNGNVDCPDHEVRYFFTDSGCL